jgi:beta-glucosidase
MDKPAEELKAFGKTGLLQPGETQTLVFTLMPRDLASFSTGQEAWVAEAGEYKVEIGASSEDIRLSKSFTLAKNLTVAKVNKALSPQVSIDEMRAPAK